MTRLPRELPRRQLAPVDLSSGVEIADAEVSGDCSGAAAAGVSLESIRARGWVVTSASLRKLRAATTDWADCDLSAADLSEANLSDAVFRATRLTGLNLAEATLRNVTFEGCQGDLVSLRFARLTSVTFRGCVLREADLSNAQLTDVDFDACDLTSARFDGASLKDVDLRGSNLTGVGGVGSLRGAAITSEQLVDLIEPMAAHLGLSISDPR